MSASTKHPAGKGSVKKQPGEKPSKKQNPFAKKNGKKQDQNQMPMKKNGCK